MSVMSVSDYRKLWKSYNGPIPRDTNGKRYDIHHIDGNHKNNSIENLKAVTLDEHYNIHYKQKDFAACSAIAIRMALTKEEQFNLLSSIAKERVTNGTHPFLGGEIQRRTGHIGGKKGGAYAKKHRTGIFALTSEQHKAKAFSANITKAIKAGKACNYPREKI